MLLVVLAILLLASLTQRPRVSLMAELAAVALLILLFTASQVLLYAKSGINDRYLIPGTLSLAFLVIYLIAKIEQLVKAQVLRAAVSIVLVLGTLLSLSAQAANSWAFARTFAVEGPPLQQALEKISASTGNSDVIVLAADPARDYEGSIAVREYLRVLFDRKKVFVYLLWTRPENEYSAFEKELGKSYDKDLGELNFGRVDDKSQVKAIFTFTHASTDKAFHENMPDWFRSAEFVRNDYGLFVVYTTR
jgi:hypothetical protein